MAIAEAYKEFDSNLFYGLSFKIIKEVLEEYGLLEDKDYRKRVLLTSGYKREVNFFF